MTVPDSSSVPSLMLPKLPHGVVPIPKASKAPSAEAKPLPAVRQAPQSSIAAASVVPDRALSLFPETEVQKSTQPDPRKTAFKKTKWGAGEWKPVD